MPHPFYLSQSLSCLIRSNFFEKDLSTIEEVEKTLIIEAILHSLDKLNPDLEQAWVDESETRYEAYRRGELEATDWDEIKKKYES